MTNFTAQYDNFMGGSWAMLYVYVRVVFDINEFSSQILFT